MENLEELEDLKEEPRRRLHLFGRDITQIPCFRDSFLFGIPSGIGIGLIAFVRTSRPRISMHVGFTGFMITTIGYWFTCRYQWSQQRFAVAQLQEALKNKIIYEGTSVEKELDAKLKFEDV